EEINSAALQPDAAPGDLQFADLNGDEMINGDDRTIIGNPNPDYTAGITNSITYCGLELSFLFQGSFGNDIYNQTKTFTQGMFQPNNASVAVLDRWTPQNADTNIPRAVMGDPNNNRRIS